MERSKVLEYFDAKLVRKPIHIIGCGAIGSHVAEQLTRIGCENIHLWDFDTVEPKNITNQMFYNDDIGTLKVDAVASMMLRINPDIRVIKHEKGINSPYIVNGHLFLCVDSIELRKEIVEANRNNPNCKSFFDFRMRLTDAQHFFANNSLKADVDNLIRTMDFTHEEAAEATPKSACGVELSVIYTVKAIVSYGISNFCKFCLGQEPKNLIMVDFDSLCVNYFPVI